MKHTDDPQPRIQSMAGMAMPGTRSNSTRQLVLLLCVWLVCILVYVGVTVRSGVQQASRDLDAAGVTLHRVISQLTAQHDAHLTNLSALINSATPPPADVIAQVSQNILKFYPRIAGIDIVRMPYRHADAPTLVSVPGGTTPMDYTWIADKVNQQQPGRVQAYVKPGMSSVYFLAKRANAAAHGFAIVMRIDATQLFQEQEYYAGINMLLSLDGRTILQQRTHMMNAHAFVLGHPRFSRVVDNQSQAFALHIDKPIYLQDVFDVTRTIIVAIVLLLLVLVVHFAWLQRNRAKVSQRSAQQAELRARLLEHENRLAHASRVNALGEMASGIAHELTQPLTALLSQSQAAVRLLGQTPVDTQLMAQALDANVREAKRAGAMLKRMRDYMSNTPPKPMRTSLNDVAKDVAALMHADLARRGIRLVLQLDEGAPHAVVDIIEMEQVLHNLVRNAADALDLTTQVIKTITLSTSVREGHVIVEVHDNGRGIAEDILLRLFEPFFTTKESGMGLGLSLCATLVDRVGGHIEARNHPEAGAVFTVSLPLPAYEEML